MEPVLSKIIIKLESLWELLKMFRNPMNMKENNIIFI